MALNSIIRFKKFKRNEKPEKGPRRNYGLPELIETKPHYDDAVMQHVAGREVTHDQFALKLLQELPEVKKVLCGRREFLYRADQNVGTIIISFYIRSQGLIRLPLTLMFIIVWPVFQQQGHPFLRFFLSIRLLFWQLMCPKTNMIRFFL